MPSFKFEAIDETGRTVSGQINSDTDKSALRTLISRGLSPLNIQLNDEKQNKKSWALGSIPKTQDYILSLKQLSLLINSGVPLITAVETLKNQSTHNKLQEAFGLVARDLRSGQTFSEALRSSIPEYPAYVYQLSLAGESIGELGNSLNDASKQMEYEYKIKQEIKNALTYPSILVLAGISAVVFIFIVVVPRFSAMLNNQDQQLPYISKLVLSTGMFLSENTFLVFLVTLILALTTFWMSKNRQIKDRINEILIKLPILGSWIIESELSKWSSMMGTMIKHGVDLIQALKFAESSVSIKSMKMNISQISKLVRSGNSLSHSMNELNIFSNTALSLVKVGEESGELSQMLGSLSNLYEDSGRQRMKKFLLILEPAAIILIGLVIGGIVTAIMLAITSINQINL